MAELQGKPEGYVIEETAQQRTGRLLALLLQRFRDNETTAGARHSISGVAKTLVIDRDETGQERHRGGAPTITHVMTIDTWGKSVLAGVTRNYEGDPVDGHYRRHRTPGEAVRNELLVSINAEEIAALGPNADLFEDAFTAELDNHLLSQDDQRLLAAQPTASVE